MKNQILTLIISAVVLTASPVFAMDEERGELCCCSRRNSLVVRGKLK